MLIRKHLKHDKALQTIYWARKYRIEVCGFFMIGFPGESLEEIRETLDFAVSAPLDTIFISLVSPFKGTVLRTDMMNGRFGEMDGSGMAALEQLFPTVHNEAVPVAMVAWPGPDGITIEIRDTGPGLGPEVIVETEDLAAGRSGGEPPRHLGFGLRLAGRLVRVLGGSLTFATSRSGTTCLLRVPDLAAEDTVPRRATA